MSQETPAQNYRISIRRPVTMAMIFLCLFVFGWKSYQELPINLMPDISYPTLTVRTEYENAAPEDVEELVTRPLEEALSLVNGIVEVSSVSSAGLSEVILEFTWGTNMTEALQDVRESLDLVNLPQAVTKKPVILRYDPTLDPVFRVGITGRPLGDIPDPDERRRVARHDLTAIREDAERHIKSDLEAQEGIAQVLVRGGREQEVQILVDAARTKNVGLSVQYVADAIRQQNINLSGGRLKEGKSEYLVRTLNEFQNIKEIREMVLTTPDGQPLRLKDVATVQMGEKERETIVRIDGNEAVGLEIYKEGDANTVDVCNDLKDFFGFERDRGFFARTMAQFQEEMLEAQEARMQEAGEDTSVIAQLRRRLDQPAPVKRRLPNYADLTLISDQSRFIVAAIREVQSTAVIGGVLALIILFFFLREIRSTLIVGVAIPISIIATFVPMFLQDISLNLMSLGGLALGVGMLVDNSIVVLESIFRCKEEGDDVVTAADRGTREVASAVTASTLTTIAVFFPIVFVEGVAGQVFRDLALTVTFSLLASLLVALYLIPMIASRTRPEFLSAENPIWVLRAYRENRAAGRGRIGAVLRLVPRSFQSLRDGAVDTWRDTVGTGWATINGRRAEWDLAETNDKQSPSAITERVGAAVMFPLVVVLFVLQSVLKFGSAIIVGGLFLAALIVVGAGWAVARLIRWILWFPLRAFDTVFYGLRNVYEIFLGQALRFGPVFLLVVIAVAAHAGYVAMGLGRELIPPLKQGEFGIRMEAPPGTRLEDTERQARRIENIAREMPDVATVTMEVGSEKVQARDDRGENVAEFTIQLKNPDETVQYQDEIMEALRSRVAKATSNDFHFTLPQLFTFKDAIELQIRGDDLDELRRLGRAALAMARTVPGVKDAELSLQEGYPEIIVNPDRELLASRQVSPFQMAERLRREVQGEVPTDFSRGAEKIPIRVMADERDLNSLEDLRSLSIVDGSPPVPLQSVAAIEVKEGPSEIRRVDQRRVVMVTANVVGRDLGAVSEDIMSRIASLNRSRDYQFVLSGQNRELETSYQGLQFALLLAVFLVYVVMACQFESIWHPALIMFSVPLAFIGVIYMLDSLDISLSIVVFMGGIVLAGIVVNDAIVLVDYINQLRRRGLAKRQAIITAGRVRFRPIIMTTLTTILGLLPMALWTGEGAEMRQPMAVTVIAGLTSATVLTLVIIPLIYDFLGGRDKTA